MLRLIRALPLAAAGLCALGVASSEARAELETRPFQIYFGLGPGLTSFGGEAPLTGVSVNPRTTRPPIITFGRPFDLSNQSFDKHYPGTGFGGTLRLGFTIYEVGSLEFNMTGLGFDLSQETRGGGGFVGGTLKLHPLEIAGLFAPQLARRNRPAWPLEVSIPLGLGYTIVGAGDNIDDFGRQGLGQEGSYFATGVELEWFFGETFALGLDLRVLFANYDGEAFFSYDEKGTEYVQIEERSAVVFAPALTFNFHFDPVSAHASRLPAQEEPPRTP